MVSIYTNLKRAGTSAIAGIMAYTLTGCADIRPHFAVRPSESGDVETRVGIVIGDAPTNPAENPNFHGGFWTETGQTIYGPYHIYRAADGKWFPQWREHPYRTTASFLIEGGIVAAIAASSGGSSGGSKSKDKGDSGNDNNGNNGGGHSGGGDGSQGGDL